LASNLDITNADEEMIQSESQLLGALADYATSEAFLEAAIAGPL
jgi:outer membrane protein TolC